MNDEESSNRRPDLTSEQWQAITKAVGAALDLPPNERAPYIAQIFAHDERLRHAAERLLATCEDMDNSSFLVEPASVYAAPLIDTVQQEDDTGAEMLRRVTSGLAPRYVVHRELGRGGMATVYLAWDQQNARNVAIKVMRDDASLTMGAERFLREIRFTAALRHLNIVPLYESSQLGDVPYYVMPFIDGESLAARLGRERQLSFADALSIVRDVGNALDYAHAHGVIHRDIKPQNILLEGGRAMVTDFGVARALANAGAAPLTKSAALGTPLYMSPEQAGGDRALGPPTDVYALGVMLFEMLAGEPPYTAPTVRAVLAKHMTAPIPDLRVVRPSAGKEIQQVIERALAKLPVERYASGGELAQAFGDAVTARTTAMTSRRWWAPVVYVAGALATLALLARFTSVPAPAPGIPLGRLATDTNRLALFPLTLESTSPVGDDELFRRALARWQGIDVFDRTTSDLLEQSAAPTKTRALAIARTLGAGRYILGTVTRRGLNRLAHATLFDAAKAEALAERSVDIPDNDSSAAAAYERLADDLLLRADVDRATVAQTRSLAAIQAVQRGLDALDEWDLDLADSTLTTAVGKDPAFPRANFLLAQTRAWQSRPLRDWASLAARAEESADRFSDREQSLLRALVYLAHEDFASACREYEQLERVGGAAFPALFGQGQCRTMDHLVVPDARSTSGWRFRSSYHRAVKYYRLAFDTLPKVHIGYQHDAFERLRSLLFVSTDLVTGKDRRGNPYFARVGLEGDTLVLVPYPASKIFGADAARTVPPRFREALVRQHEAFRDIAHNWSVTFPESPGAKLAVAISLELLGDPHAIDTLRVARRLEGDSTRQRVLAEREAILRAKFGAPRASDLSAAGALIDSLLENPSFSPRDTIVASLALLGGRCGLAASVLERTPPASDPAIPAAVYARSRSLLARSSIGCPEDSLSVTLQSLVEDIDREVPGASTDSTALADMILLYRPALLASTLDSAVAERLARGNNTLARVARAVARHDTSGARQELAAFAAQWDMTIGVTPDIGYVEASLWAQTGDTANAVRWLDRTLKGASQYDPAILLDPARAGAFVRAMVLRADLAWKQRDRATAARWGAAVEALWSHPDEELRGVRRRMVSYARGK